jgi:hypothetical protein
MVRMQRWSLIMSIYRSVGLLNRLNFLKYEGQPCFYAGMQGCPMCGNLSWPHVTTQQLARLPVAKAQTACLDASPFPARQRQRQPGRMDRHQPLARHMGRQLAVPPTKGMYAVSRPCERQLSKNVPSILTFAVKPAALARHKSDSVTSLLPVLAGEVKGRERG